MEFSQIELTNQLWDGITKRELPSTRAKQGRMTSRLASRALLMNKSGLLEPIMSELNLIVSYRILYG